MKRKAYEISNNVSLGSIEAAHQNVLNARDPRDEYVRHQDNTSRQAASLDMQLNKAIASGPSGPSENMVVVNMEINGIVLPMKLDITLSAC